MHKNQFILKLSVAIGYVAMVYVNYLANALPINGVTTGAASDKYGNLFTPAGITFAIWGVIYLLLLAYTLYQFGVWQKDKQPDRERLFARINPYFLLTSVANITWIFSWHYGIIWLSVLIMLMLLILLIRIADGVNAAGLAGRDALCIRAPFSIYFGWITVATIANITVLLVSIRWDGFGIPDAVWTVVILCVGALIGSLRMWKDRNIVYGATIIWAYGGIWLKHASASGFGGKYPSIIATVIICIVVFLGIIGALARKGDPRKTSNP